MFSKQVITDIVMSMPEDHASLDMYLLKYDLDDKIVLAPADSIKKKKVAIAKFLVQNQGIRDNYKNDIVTLIVEDRISYLLSNYSCYNFYSTESICFDKYPNLYKYLRFEGYDIDIENKKLIRKLPEDFEISNKEDSIIDILNIYGFTTTKGHYEQAKGSYLGANYSALNSQLRTYTESLFVEMAQFIKNKETSNSNIASIVPANTPTAMQVLVKCFKPILDINLNEWTGDNKGYIQGLWNRLHPQGCHPGLPSIDEAIFRFQLVILNTHNLLCRFQSFY